MGRQPVYGTISGAEGQSGLISFIPEDKGPAARAKVTNGSYEFDESNGPMPGNYRVVVHLEKKPAGSGTVAIKGVAIPEKEATALGGNYERRTLSASVAGDGSPELDLVLPPYVDPEPIEEEVEEELGEETNEPLLNDV